ncbi:MAG: methyltransferase domain-containing protein [Nitrospira sp.]|jgi:ribosomal protein RSM22 (predicted rRNA methylase)|nr:methyltransferase domain-containing protein [Nitrospira sp.]MDI3464709.1 Methyltransferase [Nitrospira sp.]
MRRLNATVSPSLLDAINEPVETPRFSQERLARAVAELSRRFTKDRNHLSRTYLDDDLLRAAYLQYFLPVNLAKIQLLLNEMPTPEPVERFSVLDIGSGPGTGTLAALAWWHQQKLLNALSVTAVDGSSGALRQARQLWDRYCRMAGIQEADLQTYVGNLERREWSEQVRQKGPFDLVILSNCLNEIHINGMDPIEAKTGLVVECLSLLTPAGTIMIVEPALRETSRALHQVRDRLLQEKRCTIYSPCLHEGNCPALVKPDDWCHEERAWEPPVSIREIDEEVGFIKDALKFSYLLLRKDVKTIVDRKPDVYRVVSELRVMKGEKRAWLCNEQGRQEVGRQDRLASSHNEAFDQWHRGAIVQIGKIVHKERKGKVSALGRIERDMAVQLIRSA